MDKHALRSALSTLELIDNRANFFTALYNAPNGLTRQEIAYQMFPENPHKHSVAGVLASISKNLGLGKRAKAYREYLDEIEENGQIRLRLSDMLRQTIDELPGFRNQLRV